MGRGRRRLRGAENRLLRGSAPLVIIAAALAVMVALVPSRIPDDVAASGSAGRSVGVAGEPATGWGDTVSACADREQQVVGYEGRGLILPEFTGGGQDAATNDSIKVANEIQAFADVTGLTQPYADALARNEVISVGAPYMSREWFESHRPYAWSTFPDCTITAEAGAIYANLRLFGREAR